MADTMRTTPASPVRGTTTPVPAGDRRNGNGQTDGNGGALGDVKEIGTELASAVRDSATSLFEEQRNRAADEIAALGQALRQSARALDQSGGSVARYADQAAQQIGDFATTLRGRSWNEMAVDVEDFGRRWPLAFMAAAVGVGFAAGRFLMASAGRSEPPSAGMSSSSSTAPALTGASGTAGTVGGGVSSSARAGYGAMASRENG
jgi:hypothetical protein